MSHDGHVPGNVGEDATCQLKLFLHCPLYISDAHMEDDSYLCAHYDRSFGRQPPVRGSIIEHRLLNLTDRMWLTGCV